MNVYEQGKLAVRLLNLPEGEASRVVDNGCWQFTVHRYRDGWTVLWAASVFERHGPKMGRDIGRVFVDSLDLVNFVHGEPMPQYVLEAQDVLP